MADGEYSDRVESLVDDGISVKSCSNTLDMFDLAEADLVDGVVIVSSDVGELTRLQNDGYPISDRNYTHQHGDHRWIRGSIEQCLFSFEEPSSATVWFHRRFEAGRPHAVQCRNDIIQPAYSSSSYSSVH